jgi:hypothetical protein
LVTVIGRLDPVGAVLETVIVAVIVVPEPLTLTDEKVTPVGPVSLVSELKPVPVTVKVVVCPRATLGGEMEVIVGPATTVRQLAQVAVPPLPLVSVNVYAPVAEPALTVTFTVSVEDMTAVTFPVTPVLGPVNFTLAGLRKPVPLTVTVTLVAPCPNVDGFSDVAVGAASIRRHPVHVALLAPAITLRS